MRRIILIGCVVFLTGCFFSGCGGGGSRSTTIPVTVTVTEIRVIGTISESTTATVRSVSDQDLNVNTSFLVAFDLDGGSGSTSLPVAPAVNENAVDYVLPIVLIDTAGNTVTRTLTCTLNP